MRRFFQTGLVRRRFLIAGAMLWAAGGCTTAICDCLPGQSALVVRGAVRAAGTADPVAGAAIAVSLAPVLGSPGSCDLAGESPSQTAPPVASSADGSYRSVILDDAGAYRCLTVVAETAAAIDTAQMLLTLPSLGQADSVTVDLALTAR